MIRDKIIEIANSQLGVGEVPPNTNKTIYGKWYGLDGFPWCAMFVSWVYNQAGTPLGYVDDHKGYRDCNSAYYKWKSSNEITANPEKADIVLFDWQGDGKCDHTGIFHEWFDVEKKYFWSYEGNTSTSDDSNGGLVMRRKRSVSMVKAFVRPRILGGQIVSPPVEAFLKKGSKGSDVVKLQRLLYDLKYSVTVDGDFGDQTEQVVKQFQKNNAFDITGIATPSLIGFIEGKLAKPAPDKKLTTGSFLKKGCAGAPVVMLQDALNRNAENRKITVDGVFGLETEKALKEFQLKKAIKADGIAGPETFAALNLT